MALLLTDVSAGAGASGFSGYSGLGASGFSGYSGVAGGAGTSGFSGYSGSLGGFTTNSDAQVNSLGVGTAASTVTGEIRATNNITAYYSDERLKDFHGRIPNAVEKVIQLNGYYFTENEIAKSLGYNNNNMQVGVSAQEVEKVMPEVVTEAPIDSKYKTVYYEKLVPLLIEAVKEQQVLINDLQVQINSLGENNK